MTAVSVVGEMDIERAVVVRTGMRPPGAGDGWLVTVDEDGEVVAAAPADRVRTDDPMAERDIIVLDAACPVAAALNSPAFAEVRWPPTVVVHAGDGIVGVWADEDLADVWPHRLDRGSVDIGLPGEVLIPRLRRRCGFRDKARCSERRDFVVRRDRAVPCGNPDGLTEHNFVW
ncbi:hypothetical protein ACLQ2Y_14210 [Micromonospora echinospora]|uniref:hypothetical protein n=1 Tax=Micromonospora echinospora TaxID=1877 RepID=UPI003CF25204